MNVNISDPTPIADGCVPWCPTRAGGDHEQACAEYTQAVDLTRSEIDALIAARRALGSEARAVHPDYHLALDRAVVKLHVGLVQVAMVSIPVTESELRLLDGNR